MDEFGLREVMKLKDGENRHITAHLMQLVHEGQPVGMPIYEADRDGGLKARLPGWTNMGDFAAALNTYVSLGNVYKDSPTPHIVVASKHTRPVIIANGKSQLEALVKAIAGDLNSPFGGIFGFNTPLELETARFLDKMFIEGTISPDYESGVPELLRDTEKVKAHRNRLLLKMGNISISDLYQSGTRYQPLVMANGLRQTLEPAFDALKETVLVSGDNPDISSLPKGFIDDITFAGNAALYLNSNLVFFVHNGAIAGLGDGCGARTVAAQKARNMLEISAYAALSANNDRFWEAVLFDTPFTRDDFAALEMPLRLIGFSDAFFPKPDGFIETAGLDRLHPEFGQREVKYPIDKKGTMETFIPKRNNFSPEYDRGLIPKLVVSPGGSLGDKALLAIAGKYNVQNVFTMTPEQHQAYKRGEAGVTGRRFFGHSIMN